MYKPTRFIEVDHKADRVTRFTAHDNTLAKLAAKRDRKTTECLEAEQLRLIQTFHMTVQPD